MNGNNIDQRSVLKDNDEELSEIVGLLNCSEDSIMEKNKNNYEINGKNNNKSGAQGQNKLITTTRDNFKQTTILSGYPP